jgi:uncharacterized protein YxeA
MKKEILAISALMCIILISGCISQNQSSAEDNAAPILSNNTSAVQKIEILHFHGTHQCYSCITVGKYAEETVSTYFTEEVKAGKVSFAHINVDLPENSEVVARYGAAGSSLWIGVYDKSGFHAEQNTNVWYKIENESDYKQYLKEVIESKLSGE